MIYFFSFVFSTLSNYGDNSNLLASGADIELINQMLLSNFRTVNNWFCKIFMILNPGKCHFMSAGKDTHDEDIFIMITLPSQTAMKKKY